VEGDRLDRRIFGLAEAWKHLQHFIFPDVDGHRKRDSCIRDVRAVGWLADAVRGRGQQVVGDPLHIIAGVDDDRAVGSAHPHPLAAPMIPDLQAIDPRRGKDGEQVDVLVAEQSPRA